MWAYLRLRNDRREANAYKLTLTLRGRYPVSVTPRVGGRRSETKGLASVRRHKSMPDRPRYWNEDILVCHFDVCRG